MAYSTQRATSDGTMAYLDLSIDYMKRADINVFYDGLPADQSTWSWVGTTDKRIAFSPVIPNGVEVLLKRTTQITGIINVFANGAKFNNATMDQDFTQLLYLNQEAVEGAALTDIFNDVDFHGYRITNMGDATADNQAVSLGQLKTMSTGAYAAQIAAQAAQTASEAARDLAQKWASQLTTTVDGTSYSAKQYALNAAGSATAASGSASAAASSATASDTSRIASQAAQALAQSAAADAEAAAAPATDLIAQVNAATDTANGAVQVANAATDTANAVQAALTGKNLIINGECMYAQRGPATYGPTSGGYAGPDRFFGAVNGAGGSYTQSQGSLVWNGVTYSTIKQTAVTPAASFAGTNNWTGIIQRIQGYNCYDVIGKTLGVQLLFKASISGTYALALQDGSGTQSIVSVITAVAGVVQQVKISWPAVPTGAAIPRSNAIGLILRIGQLNNASLIAPSTGVWVTGNYSCVSGLTQWSQTAGATIEATLIQLERGVPTAFDFEDIGFTEMKCQQYYRQNINLYGNLYATTGFILSQTFGVPMRAVPTLTATNFNVFGVGTPSGVALATVAGTSTTRAYAQFTCSAITVQGGGPTLADCIADAEL